MLCQEQACSVKDIPLGGICACVEYPLTTCEALVASKRAKLGLLCSGALESEDSVMSPMGWPWQGSLLATNAQAEKTQSSNPQTPRLYGLQNPIKDIAQNHNKIKDIGATYRFASQKTATERPNGQTLIPG